MLLLTLFEIFSQKWHQITQNTGYREKYQKLQFKF